MGFKTRVAILIIFAWAAPISMILLYAYGAFQMAITDDINENFINRTVNSTVVPAERINRAITLSRKASADKYLETLQKAYEKGQINGVKLNREIAGYLTQTYYNQKEIEMAIVELNSTREHYFLNTGAAGNSAAYSRAREKILFLSNYSEAYISFYIDENFDAYLFRNLIIIENSRFKKIGVMVLKLRKEYIFESPLREFKSGESFTFSINGLELPIVKSEDTGLTAASLGFGKSEKSAYYAGKIKTSDYILIYRAVSPNDVLYKELQDFRDYSLTVSFAVAPAILALAVLIINNVYRSEVAARDAKIASLLARINPHFLNNTFEITNWQIRLGNYESAEKMIESLAALFNAAMNRESSATTTLSSELEYCDAYLYIIKMRYGDKLEIIKDANPETLNRRVPALIIQPLLENAVKHGIEPAGGGRINLSIFLRENKIFINVTNDGKQISEAGVKNIEKLLSGKDRGFSMGLLNVQERLKLIYGKKSFIKISSENGLTLATICVPIN
jgi:hypothetical protein